MENVEVYEVENEDMKDCYNQTEVSTPQKRKSKSQEEDLEKPKKPRSAYLLYYFDVHPIIQQEIPNLPQSEINKRISESWKRLNVAEKAYYLEKAKSEKEGTDTSSMRPFKDLPGFRKILPRASYVLLSKSCPSKHQLEGSHLKNNVESPEPPTGSDLPSVSLSQEAQLTHLGAASEAKLSEFSVTVEDSAEHVTEDSRSAVQGQLPSSSDATISKAASADRQVSLKENESIAGTSGYSWAMVQQVQGESTKVVAIIPSQTQRLMQPKVDVSSMTPMMMVPVGAKVEQNSKPSYKMSVKTYTRRGRGRCLNPACSFVYVTRHKPPTCPECGTHLGGKWIPATKKAREKKKQLVGKPETSPDGSSQITQPPTQVGNDDDGIKDPNESKKEGQLRKPCGPSTRQPLEGSSSKAQNETKRNMVLLLRQTKNQTKGTSVPGRTVAIVQKRPVRPILPAYYNTGRALFQIITVPPNEEKHQAANSNYSVTAAGAKDTFSVLKPSTLKQLGQIVPAILEDSPVSADGFQPASSLTDGRVNLLSVVPFKQSTVSSIDLGLSTARGRGRCKNPSCDYIYKNRHKPEVCPKCSCELSHKNTKGTKTAPQLDPYQPLSPAQKDVQRQNTLQLLRRSLVIPEGEAELQETLSLIQELNGLQIILVQPGPQELEDNVGTETLVETGWPQFYESAATHCGLCSYPLFKGDQSTVAGQEDCWLLTETLIQTASLQLKVCLNLQCLALHSFTDLHPGLFNIGNKLLVSIDLFLKIRANIRLGQSPSQAARTILEQIPNHPVHTLSPEEFSQIQELLLSGYWAFECLTVRDYNDMICGICGIAPKLKIGQSYMTNVLELKNVEFTWPEYSVSDEVHVDDFWLTMETEAIEQAAFPANIPITRVDASIIAPFIPPLMRSATVINTEKDKVASHTETPSGNPSVLVRLIHDGQLKLDKVEDHSQEELKAILDACGVTISPDATKNELLASVIAFYTYVHSGLSTAPQPPQHHTAGKLSLVCPHKVVCGSKYLVKGETARDHVDLLLSSRYWPPVYVNECAQQVALCTDLQYPKLATQMWGRNQGCFCDPFEKPEFVSCAELQDQLPTVDFSFENQQIHPITKSSSCWLVRPPVSEQPGNLPAPEHHSFFLCRELEPYVSMVAELQNEKEEREQAGKDCTEKPDQCPMATSEPRSPVVFSNTAYYYLYNRLVDFLSSREIVNQQINQVVKECQPGDVVIRDALYRLGVAQIHTDEEEGAEEQTTEGGMEEYTVVS